LPLLFGKHFLEILLQLLWGSFLIELFGPEASSTDKELLVINESLQDHLKSVLSIQSYFPPLVLNMYQVVVVFGELLGSVEYQESLENETPKIVVRVFFYEPQFHLGCKVEGPSQLIFAPVGPVESVLSPESEQISVFEP